MADAEPESPLSSLPVGDSEAFLRRLTLLREQAAAMSTLSNDLIAELLELMAIPAGPHPESPERPE
jgi:hypothetical protein